MSHPPDAPEDQDPPDEEEGGAHVLEFTPDDETGIEDIAVTVVDMMQEYGMDCDIHFPFFTMEVEQGATAEEIVEGYQEILAHLAEQMTEQPG